MSQPGPRSVLEALTRPRLAAVGRELGTTVPASGVKEAQIEALASSPALDLPGLLRLLGRDELARPCRAHGLDDPGRSRSALMARLLAAAGHGAAAPVSTTVPVRRGRPEAGDIVQVRHRQYLVEEAVPGGPDEASRIVLSGLDDDNQGRRLEVLWEIELGGRVLQPELHGPDTGGRLDPPRAFAAYLNALRWNAVTATDARLFQTPFRAGIQLLTHQLTPLSPTEPKAREQIRQIEQDRHSMEGRLLDIDREIETEPAAIQDLYRVALTRREPVGMVYLWPAVRG